MNASDRRDERGSALPLVLVAALALFAVLLARPQGLLGSYAEEKV